jgi:hypothetical protein
LQRKRRLLFLKYPYTANGAAKADRLETAGAPVL